MVRITGPYDTSYPGENSRGQQENIKCVLFRLFGFLFVLFINLRRIGTRHPTSKFNPFKQGRTPLRVVRTNYLNLEPYWYDVPGTMCFQALLKTDKIPNCMYVS